MKATGAELRDGDRVYVEGEWLALEAVGPSAEAEPVIVAFCGPRALYFALDGQYTRRARSGEFVAIDLDENNRHALQQRRERHPGREFPALGWGVCRHGHGLQAYLPRLSEHEARYLAAMLTEEASRWRPASNGAGARHWFLIRDAQASVRDRYHHGATGQLVRYGSCKGAQRAADRLNEDA